MNALLDTHAFLWWVMGDPRLSDPARAFIRDPDNTLFVSVASIWEIVIKYQLGKLTLPEPPKTYIPARIQHYGFRVLTIEMAHAFQIGTLANHHRDPFDRLLIAQSQVEQMPLVTTDKNIQQYNVNTIW